MTKIKMNTTCVTRDLKSYKKGKIYSVSDAELKMFNAGFYEIVAEEKKEAPVKKPVEKKTAPTKRKK